MGNKKKSEAEFDWSAKLKAGASLSQEKPTVVPSLREQKR
jgi:hypothetical protein